MTPIGKTLVFLNGACAYAVCLTLYNDCAAHGPTPWPILFVSFVAVATNVLAAKVIR